MLRIIRKNLKLKFVKIGYLKVYALMEIKLLYLFLKNYFLCSAALLMDIMNYKIKLI